MKFIVYRCNSSNCDWSGPLNDTVHPKHDETMILCPVCYETVEEFEIDVSTVYAVRQKSTGYYLPMRWKSARGYTHNEPEPSFPRILPSLLSAKRALSAWLQGEWKERFYTDYWTGHKESSGASPEPPKTNTKRNKDDMEIVRLSLHIEEVCE